MAVPLIVGGVGALVTAGVGVDQHNQQVKGLKRQDAAQKTAEAQAASAARKTEEAANAARSKTPDINQILEDQKAVRGVSSTMLTNNASLALGRKSLLGS